jgi:hypothetical protein
MNRALSVQPQVRYTACLAVGAHERLLKQQDGLARALSSSSPATATNLALQQRILEETHASLVRILGDSTERGVQHAAAKVLKSLLPVARSGRDPATLSLAASVLDVCARVIQDQVTVLCVRACVLVR